MRRSTIVAALAGLALAGTASSAVAAETPVLAEIRSSLQLPVRGAPLTQVGGSVGAAPSRFRSSLAVQAPGYEIGVFNLGGAVVLDVAGPRSETFYLARGVATPRRLRASFGRFGGVSMRFRAASDSNPAPARRNCERRHRFLVQRGLFVGQLRFRGEEGYLSARAHRARGSVSTAAPQCRPGPGRGGRGSKRSTADTPSALGIRALAASWHEGVDSTAFVAVGLNEHSLFLARSWESRGRLAILRIALAKRGSPFRVSNALTSASASPPAPFHGTGLYRAAPDGTTTWTGDLSVDFPGAPRFPLTGPQFKAAIAVPF
jgi:hypothetical protein